MATASDGGTAAAEKPAGLFGRMFGGGGKRFKAAKMGKQLEMYYDENVRRRRLQKPPSTIRLPIL